MPLFLLNVSTKEVEGVPEKRRGPARLFGSLPLYWSASAMRSLNPLVDVTEAWCGPQPCPTAVRA